MLCPDAQVGHVHDAVEVVVAGREVEDRDSDHDGVAIGDVTLTENLRYVVNGYFVEVFARCVLRNGCVDGRQVVDCIDDRHAAPDDAAEDGEG